VTNVEFPKTVTRGILYRGDALTELKKFETEKGVPLRQIPLKDLIHFNKATQKCETVGVEPTLIAQKLMDNVIIGQDFVPLWNKISRVVTMDVNKVEQPIISYGDFKVKKGGTGGHIRTSGGFFSNVELDTSDEQGMYRVEVALRKTWIRDNKWSAVEESFRAAGQTMYDEVLLSIITKYLADVDSTMTAALSAWGNSHYKAFVKMVSLISAKKMYPDLILIHPDELYDLGIQDYFIHQNYSALAGKVQITPTSGLFGYLFPNDIPIYFHPNVTAASMICADSQRAAVLGVRQDLTIENFDNVIEGEEGAVVSMQWDVKTGADALPASNVKYAWAVCTAA